MQKHIFKTAGLLALLAISQLLFACSKAPETETEASAMPAASPAMTATDSDESNIRYQTPQFSWQDPPTAPPVEEGYVDVGGASLWYWDTGGDGEAVVFSHPGSGSGLTWDYQKAELTQAGYRVIGYSRRGHYQSEVTDYDTPGSATDDLRQVLDHLNIEKVHIVAIAAGAGIAPDFAISYPDRVLSLMLGCTVSATGDPAFDEAPETLRPEEFFSLPVWLRELSPFYRGGNPEGTLAWTAISDQGRPERVPAPLNNEFTPALLAGITQPVLLFTGDSDFYMPPSRLRAYAAYWSNPEVVVFRGAGHAPYWEQPLAFNQTLIDFMQRHGQ